MWSNYMLETKFFSLEYKIVSQRYILLIGTLRDTNFHCKLGNIYALNLDVDRALLWDELQNYLLNANVPWCLG